MPASEAPDGDPALSPEVRTVVDRWNPQGGTLLRTAPQAADAPEPRGVADAGPVTLIAPDDPTTALLRTELARFEPRVVLTDPIGDPATLLDTPAPLPEVALVLLDPGSAVGAALVGPLTRLRLGGTRLLFALNGVHAHPDWRSVLHRDSLMLGQALGAEPEVVAVSARLAVAARAKSDAALTDRSGLPALHVALVAATEPVTEGDRSAGLTERVLIDTRSRVVNQIESLRSGTAVARLRSERTAALAGRDGGRAQALATLRNRIQLARVDLLHEVGVRVRTLNTAARADLDRLTRRTARDYPEHLQISVDRTTADLDAVVGDRLTELSRQIGVATDPDSAEAPVEQIRSAVPADPAPPVGPDPERRPRGVEDRLMIALGASAGFGLGRLIVAPLSLVPALDYATVPVTLLLGAGVAWWVVRARRQMADRAHLRQWLTDALAGVRAHLEQRVATALVEAESELTDYVVRASTARMVETDRRVAELEGQLRRTAAEQPAQLAACERDLAILDAALAR